VGEPGRRVLNDRYELDELIASGGMGQVWRGRDTRLGRSVAVKLLRSEYTGDPTFLARFRAEAHHAAALSHPNIAAVYDYGEATDVDGEHLAYLVMELVQGEALSTRLEEDGPLTPEATLSVLRQTAAALAEAHHVGLVHRDVKPGNILVEPSGRVKITDFGIAWSAGSVPLTEVGQVLGSPQYLPPELAVGDSPTPASDVYSLGLVGYECLTGQPAFDGENPVTIALKQVEEEPEPLPEDLPPGLRELVDVAVAKDPSERIPDGDAFVAAVDRVRAGRPVEGGHDHPSTTDALPLAGSLPPPVPRDSHESERHPPVAPRRRLRRVLPAVAALLVVVAGLAVVLGLTQGGGSLPEAAGTGTSQSAAIVLAADDYVGRPAEDVAAELSGLGFAVEQVVGVGVAAAPGTVTQVDPVGRELRTGDVVTVFVAGEEQPVPAGPDSAAPVGDPSDGAATAGGQLGAGVGAAARAGSAAAPVPGSSSAGTTAAGTTEPGTTEAAPTEAAPTEGAPTEGAPTEGAPTEGAPTEGAPPGTETTGTTEAAPSESASSESAPTETVPSESAPTESVPSETDPTESAPTETAEPSAAPSTGESGTSSSDAATLPSDPGTPTG
jgi:eukaryotic-like serine/threonine-protein kinase